VKRQRLTSEQWSRYWRGDSVTTFARQFNSNYDGEFAEFWNAQFAALNDGASIADLATGNGAIALLAAQYARRHGRRFSILGLDYSEIDPARVLATHDELAPLLNDIEFRGGMRIEATGLDDGSVDLLTSQYGFEYAEQDAAIAEALRVLVPGGRIALILHHSESRVVELARDGLAQVQFCLQKEELDKRVVALVKVVGDARDAPARQALKDNPKAERLRQKLNASLARIMERAKEYQDPEGFIGVMVPNFTKVFGEYKDASLTQKLTFLRETRGAFDAFRERMADLASAALAPQAFDALVAKLERDGFEIAARGAMRYRGDLMGWTLEARKPIGRVE
jgi:ubiquinone/menaquinone biosynthesis C-methylase UbiE